MAQDVLTAHVNDVGFQGPRTRLRWTGAPPYLRAVATSEFLVPLVIAFVAYYIAGTLGQATTNIRSSNLGPVWPAFGIALAAVLGYGVRVWPAIAASAFLVAFQSPVGWLTATGQAAGATLAVVTGATVLRRNRGFDPALSRLRGALTFIVVAFAVALISASIGVYSLYATGLQAYTGIGSAWLIYWLGDATGALLVTPLVFTFPALVRLQPNRRVGEFAVLLALLIAACLLVFGDLFPIRPHVLAFAVLPVVMWAAINFGVGGASLSVLVIATLATLLTAFGKGPFAESTPFVNAALLDVLFMVLSVTALALASVIAERERAMTDREQLIRAQAAMEARLRLAAIVESSNDAVLSMTFDGVIVSWNAAANRIFGYTEREALGQPMTMLIPPELQDELSGRLRRVQSGERIASFETSRLTHAGERRQVAITMSPMTDGQGVIVGAAQIIRDVTEEKRAQEALSSVTRRLIEAQEVERRRMARELHDDIGQRLAQLAMNISGITDTDPAAPPVQTRRAALERQVSEIANDVQALSHRLHSSRIELLGITDAMRHFCTEFAEQHKVTVEFSCEDVPAEIPSEVPLCLFRVLQEGLHNAMKHSGVRLFEVQLRGGDGQLHLLVRDTGTGFDVAGARTRRGLGLLSMEERIRLVNGELAIESRPGRGTSIHARVQIRG